MNFKMLVAQHWKAIVIMLHLGLVALSLVVMRRCMEEIDSPFGP